MRCCLLACLFFFCISEATAAALEAVAGHGTFRNERDSAYIQLFWQISPQTLHYKKDSTGKLRARVRTQLRISNDSVAVYKDVFYLQTKPFDPTTESVPAILEQEKIAIGEGHYTIELFLSEDEWPGSRFYYKDSVTITRAEPQYSSLQLLDTFFRSDTRSQFLKDGYQLLPRPLNFYDEGQRWLNCYAEVYHIDKLPKDAFPLKQTFFISRQPGDRDAGVVVSDTISAGSLVSGFRHSLPLASFATGNYWLNASLRTVSGAELAWSSTFFQLINKNPVVQEHAAVADTAMIAIPEKANLLDLGKTFVAKFDMAQMRAILKMIRPSANGTDEAAIHAFLQQPDELYIRYFIYNHFAAINPQDPGKAWKDFADVVREVNHRFGSNAVAGYETDRGIIYLRYGKPDEEVRMPNEHGALPYEIWRYNPNQKMHGPGLFLFYSPGSMSSDFRLLHSTVLGEARNPDWRQVLFSVGQGSGSANSRAEEYFGKQ